MSLCDILRVKRSGSCGQVKYSSSVHILRSPCINEVELMSHHYNKAYTFVYRIYLPFQIANKKKFGICLDFSPLNSANSGLFSEVTLRIGMSRTAMNLQKQRSISQFPQNCFKCEKVLSFAMGNILPFVPVSLYILVTWFFGRSYQSQLSCLFVFNNKFAYWLISFNVTWKRNFKKYGSM